MLCPFCKERVPRAAIRCVYCDTWLAVGIFRSDRGDRAPTPATGAFGRVIYLSPADFAKLEYAATIERNPRNDPLARAMVDKLGHAVVMSVREMPTDVLTVGSSARIVASDPVSGRARVVTLRHPDEDGEGDDISVLSPMGLALLGLTAGESAIYCGPYGTSRTVTVEQVFGPTEHAAARVSSFPSRDGDDDPGPTAA
jgi:regulator of nucleoside diphosphate kinase